MTHLFICDVPGCGVQSQPGTRTGGTPRGWTSTHEPGQDARHECFSCAGKAALRRVEDRPKGEPEASYTIGRVEPQRESPGLLDPDEARALADSAPAAQRALFGSDY